LVFAVAHRAAQHLAVASHADTGGHHHGPGHDLAADAAFEVRGVQEHVRELHVAERPGPEGSHLGVERGTDPRHLRLRDP
jgi:hypothetical protein